MAAALERVAREDAAVVPLLAPAECQELVDAGADLAFRSAKPVIGEGERAVYQDFDICLSIPPAHRLWQLTRAVERLIAAALGTMDRPPLEALPLNDLVLQRYPPGARGITPHRDHVRYVGLVVIVQMSGDGRFGLCADRSGAGARMLDAGPGDGILMRAPGFGGQQGPAVPLPRRDHGRALQPRHPQRQDGGAGGRLSTPARPGRQVCPCYSERLVPHRGP